jgi:hypothetical protein
MASSSFGVRELRVFELVTKTITPVQLRYLAPPLLTTPRGVWPQRWRNWVETEILAQQWLDEIYFPMSGLENHTSLDQAGKPLIERALTES